MGLVDIVILVVLVFFLFKGIFRGLLKEVCSLLGLVLGGVFAFTFYLPLAQLLQDSFSLPDKLCVWGSFLAIFLLLVFLFAVIGFVLNRFVKLIFLGGFNRLAGAIFGVVQGVVVLSMIVLALNSSVAPDFVRGKIKASQLAPPFATLGESIFMGSRSLIGQ
ncbi:membrane protein required for colicin V production [Desulfuromusa kysingii]|uniref:Membrane protein required for colicin V production n=1 Tax=Desulfuromusa kysingii TaxID=37625 RepID=A0A1H3XCU6_9BACT|nr:CvpA family protein [Desulfuromusa kysingii]SDZ97159.1 membrane protein required for colicin V production [Desulfuromusa kysingii]